MTSLMQDVRYAARSLRRSPGFTIAVVSVLALGIGANSTLFGIVNAVLLRPLPYPGSDRIVSISLESKGGDIGRIDAPTARMLMRSHPRSFVALAAFDGTGANLTGGATPERVSGARISEGLFRVMGVAPAIGRPFSSDELRSGGPPAVILGRGLWQRDFGSDPGVIGRTVRLDDESFTVVGVMPAEFRYPNGAEYWVPLLPSEPIGGGGYFFRDLVGRLRPAVGIESAREELAAARLAHEDELPAGLRGTELRTITLHERAYGDLRPALLILLATIGCVLLIACANVANLLLARSAVRTKEFALRTALGAATSRLVRQLLVESTMLALVGGALGLLLPVYGMQLLADLGPPELRTVPGMTLNGEVLLFTLVVSVATGLFFGTAPALALTRGNVQDALKSGSSALLGGGRRAGPRRTLVAGELSLAVALLIGAGLLTRSFVSFRGIDPGFRPEGVLTATITLPQARYPNAASRDALFRDLLDRVRAIPDVEAAALSASTPLGGFEMTRQLGAGSTSPIRGTAPQFAMSSVGAGYFSVFRIPILAGRQFSELDDARAEPMAIVSESMARAAFPGEDAVGKQLLLGDHESYTVAGVVADVRQLPGRATPLPMVYTPRLQSGSSGYGQISVRVRDGADPLKLLPALRTALRATDPTQPLSRVTSMERLFSESLAPRRFNVLLLGSFAVLACVLAVVGLYSVIAFLVAQRTREIGLRMALGAEQRRVVFTVVREGMLMALTGVAAGVAVSLALSRVVEGMLFRVSSKDPMVFVVVPLMLLAVAALAIVLPARRASRIDPAIALRAE